jgi:hypothetical protein
MSIAPKVIGHRRFTLLAPGLVRMEYSPSGRFEDRRSMVAYEEKHSRRFPSIEEREDRVILDTGMMKIISREHHRPFSWTSLQIQWQRDGVFQHWSPGDRDHLNLGGTVHSLDMYGPDEPLEGVHIAGME